MASPPIPFKGDRANNPANPLVGQTLMGWNQLVTITGNDALNLRSGPLRVTDYNIGIRQEGDAPDYITGRQDRTAWMKGPVISEGDLTYPFTFTIGADMFAAGAGLVFDPQESFSIQSSAHPKIEGCKIQTVSISCNSGEEIQTRATVWGIVDELNNDLLDPGQTGFEDPSFPGLLAVSSADGDDAARTVGVGFGNPDGITTVGEPNLILEQIPQWDVVQVVGAPEGMHVVGFSIEVNNNLVRNYTMGDGTGASPFGLNATTISANQRRVTGTLSWQSNMDGTIAQIVGVGLESLTIVINSPSPGAAESITLQLDNCLWNAVPPSLSATDRVVVETSFTALGANTAEFDALVMTLPDGTVVGDG